jgi:hypothetical protein
MCDYDSDCSDINLYDIPEFPGYDQLQVGPEGKADVNASVEDAEHSASKTKAESDDDVLFILSRPAQGALRPDIPMLTNTAHYVQASPINVTPFSQLRWHPDAPLETLRPLPQTFATLNRSTENVREETKAHQRQRLLRGIIANPNHRKERANAIGQLEREAAKIDFESKEAPFQISELQKLTQRVASKTEATAGELFAQYIRLARKRQGKFVAKGQREGSGSRASERVLQSLSINLGSTEESRTPVIGGKPLNRKVKSLTKSLLKLHNTVNSGNTIAKSQFKTVRGQVKQLAQGLRLNPEVELSKFDFLCSQRFDITR